MIRKTAASVHHPQALFTLFEKLTAQVRSKPVPEAVHRLRTTSRRLQTVLAHRPAAKANGRGKLLKQIARLRRRAGRVRDLDVQMAILRALRLDAGLQDRTRLLRRLAKLRARKQEKLVAAVERELAAGLLKHLQRERALTSPAVSSPARDFTAVALRQFRTLAAKHPPLTVDNLHQFRIDCKHIRYLAELSSGSKEADAVVKQFKRLQDAIGDWHDLVVLTQRAEDSLPHASSPLVAALRAQRQSKLNEALRVTAEVTEDLLSRAADLRQAGVSRRGPQAVTTPVSRTARAG